MPSVEYEHEFDYTFDERGDCFPKLVLRLERPGGGPSVEIDAYLDSGAQLSLFQGELASQVGLSLGSGPQKIFGTTAQSRIPARLHFVRVRHPFLGQFDLEIGFAEQPITRNLLGRDFFDRVQIGFREHYQKFFVTSQP